MSVDEQSRAKHNVNDYATAETRRRGALAANAVRSERAKPLRQRFAEKLEADADELYGSFKRAWRADDWKAADAAINQAFGKPDGHLSVDLQGQLEVEHTRRLTLADVAGLAAELGTEAKALEPGEAPDIG